MKRINLCDKHYTGTPYQVNVSDETKCSFCLIELYERMEKFGIIDWKKTMEEDKKKFI